jgi:hypothetical protein
MAGNLLRITRSCDGASMLLHELAPATQRHLQGAVFDPGRPDFSRPFLTRFAGFLELRGHVYIAEPLPPAVPLRMVWAEVLQHSPRASLQVLGALRDQLRLILEELHAAGQYHGALCVDNVVLTTSGIYGLLRAGVQTPGSWLCLRPVPHKGCNDVGRQASPPGGHLESAEAVVGELVAVALDAGIIDPTTGHDLWQTAGASALTPVSYELWNPA